MRSVPDAHHPLSSFLHFGFGSPLAFASYGGAWFAHGPMDRLKVELIVGDRQVQKAVDVITQYGGLSPVAPSGQRSGAKHIPQNAERSEERFG
jgi:hypothetical protein